MTILIGSLLALAGLPQEAEHPYFPLRDGASWVYSTNAGVEVTWRIAGRETIGGTDCGILEMLAGENRTRLWLSCGKEGLYVRRMSQGNKDEVMRSPLLYLKEPLRSGDRWTSGSERYSVSGPEELTIGGKTYRAMRVTAIDKATLEYWYARGVGVVRWTWSDGERTLTCELKGATTRSFPAEFTVIELPGATGRVFLRSYAGTSAKTALNRAVRDLGAQTGQPLTIASGVRDGTDQRAQAYAVGRSAEALFLVEASAAGMAVAVLWDRKGHLLRSGPALIRLLPRPVQWYEAMAPGVTGSLRLPLGWTVDHAQGGMVSASGPHGMIDLGAYVTVYTPEAARQLPIRPPLVASFSDPARALEELVPQFDAVLRRMRLPGMRWVRLLDRAPAANMPGKAAYLHVEWDRTKEGKTERWQSVVLVSMNPNVNGTWTYYSSSVMSPSRSFRRNLPVLLRIWAGWKTSDKIFAQRLKLAMDGMTACSRIVQEATLYRAETVAKGHGKWAEYIRGYRDWEDGKGNKKSFPSWAKPNDDEPNKSWKPID